MKMIVVLLLVVGLTSSYAESSGQNTRLNLKFKSATVKEVIGEIERQTDLSFMYDNNVFKVDRMITIDAENETVQSIIEKLISGEELKYELVNRYIVITSKNAPPITQQQKSISGKVTDSSGVPLPGVSVVVKGTTNGVITDINGKYSLANITENATILFSFVGMKTIEITTGNKSEYNVILSEALIEMEDVIVVGYGTQRKMDLTGSISQVKMSALENKQAVSVADYLRGSIAGLNISRSSSVTGSQSFEVRGATSIGTNTEPLLVVDGMIFSGLLNDINPNDISSIDVLKDASSSAIYGSRAAAGVIIITTKLGTSEKPTINVDAKIGISSLLRQQGVYDVDGYLNMRGSALLSKETTHRSQPQYYSNPNSLQNLDVSTWLKYDGANVPADANPTDFWLQRLKLYQGEVANYKAGKSLNWLDLVFRTGILKDYNASVSGKTKNLNYYWSLGLLDNKGIIMNDSYQNIRSRANITSDITDFLQVGLRANFSATSQNNQPADWTTAFTNSPLGDLYNADGTYTRYPNTDNMARNPLDKTQFDKFDRNYNIIGQLFAKVKLPFGIEYETDYNNRFRFQYTYTYIPAYTVDGLLAKGSAERVNYSQYDWSLDNILRWDQQFKSGHKVNVTLLYNSSKWMSWQNSGKSTDYSISEALTYHALSLGAVPLVSSDDQVETRASMMARLNYGYKNRYLLNASIRRDGYSAFGQANPWATFPSVGLGWIASEEQFLKSLPLISYLKLRLSYGINGNGDIGRYSALSRLTNGTYIRDKATIITLNPTTMPNANLKWEQTASFNVGLDINFFKNRLNLVLDGYKMSTTDMLLPRALPTLSGYTSITSNMGQLDNKGFEATINSVNVQCNNFNWKSTFTFSLNRNKIVHLYGDYTDVLDADGKVIGKKEADDPTNGRYIGHALDEIYGYKVVGVWQESEAAQALTFGRLPGDYKTQDTDPNGKLEPKDYVWQGYTKPRYRLSMRNNFTIFKALDVSFMLRSNVGQKKAFTYNDSGYSDRVSQMVFPYWTPENKSNDWGRLGFQKTGTIYKDASFVRIEDFSIGYNLPKNLLQRVHVNGARVYLNVDNIWSFDDSQWLIWDPETANPTPCTFSFGLSLSL